MITQLITLSVLLINIVLISYIFNKRIYELELRNVFLYLSLYYKNDRFNEGLFQIFKSIKLKPKSWDHIGSITFNHEYYIFNDRVFKLDDGEEIILNEKEKEILEYFLKK